MAAVDASIYEKFIVESSDKSKTVDISAGVVAFTYFENIFSPYLTARAIVTNTGGSVVGDDGKLQSVYNGLPLRGGERVLIKIASNSNNNTGYRDGSFIQYFVLGIACRLRVVLFLIVHGGRDTFLGYCAA